MDVKTLFAIMNHMWEVTTSNIYTYIFDGMQYTGAVDIDQGVAKSLPAEDNSALGREPAPAQHENPVVDNFMSSRCKMMY